MAANPPVDFQERAKRPRGTSGNDYPYAIKAADLMQDFVFATLIVDEGVYKETTGTGGHRQRRLNIPTPPGSGTHVLGAISGAIQWIATEEC